MHSPGTNLPDPNSIGGNQELANRNWFARWSTRFRELLQNSTQEEAPTARKEGVVLDFGGGDLWTKQDAFEGTQIFGATGSGKTTGSGQHIALGLLNAGFGGLVLTVKPDELDTWRKYFKATEPKRPETDFIVFEPDGDYTFNFLEYESEAAAKFLTRKSGITLTDNLVALFCAVMEVSQRGSQGGGNDAFWQKTLRQLLHNAIDLVLFAGETLNFQKIYQVIVSAPTNPALVEDANDPFSKAWKGDSYCWKCCTEAMGRISEKDRRYWDVKFAVTYWVKEFPSLSPETRSSIVINFTSMANGFLRGVLRELFSPEKPGKKADHKLRLDPDLTHQGKVVVINLPVKHYNELGQFAQVLYKFVWQRATERRRPKEPGQRPVFLWADEAQFFVNSNDMMFQTTARSAQAATIYLTQNISNYYAIMSGEKGKAETDSLLGNFQTKIFHANGDSVTNSWAADLIGKAWDYREDHSASISSRESADSSASQSSSFRQTFEHQVLPKDFTVLKKGGEPADFWVEGVIFQGGRSWSDAEETQRNYKAIRFKQNFLPEVATEDNRGETI